MTRFQEPQNIKHVRLRYLGFKKKARNFSVLLFLLLAYLEPLKDKSLTAVDRICPQ
jgi:hypothetical protein